MIANIFDMLGCFNNNELRYCDTVQHACLITRCHGLSVYPVCVCNTVRLGQVRSRHNLKPSGTRFECVSGLSV